MSRPGPKPKSTALRILEGQKDKDRYNLNEPKGSPFDVSAIPPSVASNPEALEMWVWLSPRLTKMGVLFDEDRYALEALCVTYGLWRFRPTAQMTTKLQSLLSEFGLTPSARTRLVGKLPHEAPSEDAFTQKLKSL